MKKRPGVGRIVGLTGTPTGNGLMDLWAEFKLLDMGQSIGQHRTRFFLPEWSYVKKKYKLNLPFFR